MIEAHGIGGQADLPIPLSLAVGGAGVALVLSFVVMTIAWRSTRYDGEAAPQGRPVSSRIARVLLSVAWRRTLQTAGMALFAYTVIVALFGQDSLTNPFFGIVYVWWWVGLVFASLLFGPVWRSISPLRTIHALLSRATGGDREHGIYTYPAQLGYWPAALGLFAFVWLELSTTTAAAWVTCGCGARSTSPSCWSADPCLGRPSTRRQTPSRSTRP